jgi:phosphomannomutase
VTPVTSKSALEPPDFFPRLLRTEVGSPYVIAGMNEARANEARSIVGFEANGGVLLGSDLQCDGKI